MKTILLKLLLSGQLTVATPSDSCFCHGKIYVRQNSVPVDSFTVMERLSAMKKMENSNQRVIGKEELLNIIKFKPCKH